jgi:hemerythrin-like domain-containing protein
MSIDAGPIERFANCHAGILSRFERLRALADALARGEQPADGRKLAGDLPGFIRDAVFEHHREEEEALFPAVLRSAAPGDERQLVESLIARLTREHRELEAAWARIEPDLRQYARNRAQTLDSAAVAALCSAYTGHARFEESAWLPLAERILKPLDQEALGLTLHLRHALDRVVGHI